MAEFRPWPKIARLNRDIIITEKIDGTNAAVGVTDEGEVYAQSRTRIITPEADNFGFAAWVQLHESELRDTLGPGLHFGEWWGGKIQRGYGLKDKRFSLFNTSRWADTDTLRAWAAWDPEWMQDIQILPDLTFPSLRVVPVMYHGPFAQLHIDTCLEILREHGSMAADGFKEAEGIVVWHTAARTSFKVTLEGDEKPKGA